MSVRDRLAAVEWPLHRNVPVPVVTALSILGLMALYVAAQVLYFGAMYGTATAMQQSGIIDGLGALRHLILLAIGAPGFAILGTFAALIGQRLGYERDVRTAATAAAGAWVCIYSGLLIAEVAL